MFIDNPTQPFDQLMMSLSAHSIQGKRDHMEDNFDISYQMKPSDQRHYSEWPYEYFYFGIFDGHGGSEASSFARKNLVKFITQQSDFWSSDDQDVMRAIRYGFAEVQKAMKKDLPNWSKTTRTLPSTAGTTASVLFIKNGKFYTGHVGDSRIIISRENEDTKMWIAHQLTNDHKPELASEIKRIKRAGGEVRDKLGVQRVVWKRPDPLNYKNRSQCYDIHHEIHRPESYPISESDTSSYESIPFLAIARSLGDFWSLNIHTGQYIVSPEPDVACRPISIYDKGIILATDGLWNVIGSSSAVRMLQELEIVKSGRRLNHYDQCFLIDNYYDVAGAKSLNHAKSLVYFAYQSWERKSVRSDNITVVVAILHDILAKPSKHVHPYETRANLLPFIPNPVENYELKPKLTQLGQTSTFFEDIVSGREPEFCATQSSDEVEEKIQRLEHFLVLPPTILAREIDFDDMELVYPLNYTRLSLASHRILQDSNDPETYIYIKHVTDDPGDEIDHPIKFNRFGKEVKDSSAQATQSIHDFGQPWHQLLTCEHQSLMDADNDKHCNGEDAENPYQNPNESTIEEFKSSNESWMNDDKNRLKKKRESPTKVQNKIKKLEGKDFKTLRSRLDRRSISHLRCLLNCPRPRSRSSSSECSVEQLEKRASRGRGDLKRRRMVTQSEQCNLPIV